MAVKPRKKVATKMYLDAAGEESRSPNESSVRVEFRFEDGHTLAVSKEDLPEKIQAAAMFHGLGQKIGDTYAGADSVEQARDNAETLTERLKLGEWTSERVASGPRVGDLVDAIVRAKGEAGEQADPEAIKAKLVADEKLRKGAPNNPAIAKHLAAIKAEKAAADAKEKAKAAKGSEANLGDF